MGVLIVTIFNIGDYFINNDRYLCKIIKSSQDFSGKLCFHVHIIDTNHFPIFYASELNRHVFKYLGPNEQVAQTLYKPNDEEIIRREKYERRIYLGKFDAIPIFPSDDENSGN